ncbi:hypothetical protein [Microbacterium sp. J1-1]|uniref:hypothetical protein n=1 Tax=Microbacterium sp. J1-1 TaxID=2992441 RepID=UPI00211563B3|nr:hypothetical protein [Microbacterium sp. J1-1]UUE19378.1 hypothetical protein LRQ07_11210 [Microbacterium sp. J1-1]
MNALIATTLWGIVQAAERTCIACVCMKELRGEGTCSTRGEERQSVSEFFLAPPALITLAFIGVVVLALCIYSLWLVKRDGYGPRPTRDDYDTRRPEP